ncbi:hypothetical protein VNI00_013055 [Paramarasmius palmivorus]|uniref:Uncharacterized protein n=1 Tax=Paramarasmius palmivorus TaxID=297713 RepID=A0AAW0C3K9_9AGAR
MYSGIFDSVHNFETWVRTGSKTCRVGFPYHGYKKLTFSIPYHYEHPTEFSYLRNSTPIIINAYVWRRDEMLTWPEIQEYFRTQSIPIRYRTNKEPWTPRQFLSYTAPFKPFGPFAKYLTHKSTGLEVFMDNPSSLYEQIVAKWWWWDDLRERWSLPTQEFHKLVQQEMNWWIPDGELYAEFFHRYIPRDFDQTLDNLKTLYYSP